MLFLLLAITYLCIHILIVQWKFTKTYKVDKMYFGEYMRKNKNALYSTETLVQEILDWTHTADCHQSEKIISKIAGVQEDMDDMKIQMKALRESVLVDVLMTPEKYSGEEKKKTKKKR